ncbi:hypothetical protein PPERSA_08503 [Pseudocohnilembus persalinus]|uniref:Uncharacterized protein n=1 Tax=Pseudocohnilembus persalinus TaxID=266149 RepID=A0A0V0R6G3_PSEPJ|nr:hypothetical protein PPERSA_08503 [Pseudocohnilembus persalinus]|eukprot:KRX10100.1 hypothetical protein PPERSA_08503 [Pseudocohnilembus persalinus]
MGNIVYENYRGITIKLNQGQKNLEQQDFEGFKQAFKHLDIIMKHLKNPDQIPLQTFQILLGNMLMGSYNLEKLKISEQHDIKFYQDQIHFQKDILNIVEYFSANQLSQIMEVFENNQNNVAYGDEPFYLFGEYIKFAIFHLYFLWQQPSTEKIISKSLSSYFENGVSLFYHAMKFRLENITNINTVQEKLLARGIRRDPQTKCTFSDEYTGSTFQYVYTGTHKNLEDQLFFCYRAEYQIKLIQHYSFQLSKFLEYLQIFSNSLILDKNIKFPNITEDYEFVPYDDKNQQQQKENEQKKILNNYYSKFSDNNNKNNTNKMLKAEKNQKSIIRGITVVKQDQVNIIQRSNEGHDNVAQEEFPQGQNTNLDEMIEQQYYTNHIFNEFIHYQPIEYNEEKETEKNKLIIYFLIQKTFRFIDIYINIFYLIQFY